MLQYSITTNFKKDILMAFFWRNPTPLSATPTLVADSKADSSPFFQAVDQFLAEVAEGADAKNPFVNEIKAAHQRLGKVDYGEDPSEVVAIDLRSFVQGLKVQKRAQSRHRVLQPDPVH